MKYNDRILSKLKRAEAQWSDGQGCSIGKDWLNTLTFLGLLERVQRSPAMWSITDEGFELLGFIKEE